MKWTVTPVVILSERKLTNGFDARVASNIFEIGRRNSGEFVLNCS